MIYVEIKNNKVTQSTPFEVIAQTFENVITTDYEDYTPTNNKYIFENGVIVFNPNYEQEEQEKREQIIQGLSLTPRELLLALYDDKGITPEQLKAQITERAVIEFDYAEKYYRFNPIIDQLGENLGYSKEQLNNLFINGHF